MTDPEKLLSRLQETEGIEKKTHSKNTGAVGTDRTSWTAVPVPMAETSRNSHRNCSNQHSSSTDFFSASLKRKGSYPIAKSSTKQ